MVLLTLAACVDTLADPTPYLDDARVLAVRAEPAEAEPGDPITITALYADSDGERADGDVAWGFCTARKPLAEAGPVATACLDAASEDLAPVGDGLTVDTTLPDDVCSRFGPNPPPPDEGGVSGRPVDPDASGGYYQPLLGFTDDTIALASLRTRCGLPNVDQETFIAWNLAYHDNVNPTVDTLSVDGTPRAADEAVAVSGGAAVPLTVAWPACPTEAACGDAVCSGDETLETCADDCAEPVGCTGAETYTLHDPVTGALTTVRETISVSWFATAGTFSEPRGGRAADDAETTVDTTWTAPDGGEAWIGVVVRDDRGGVGWAGRRLTIE